MKRAHLLSLAVACALMTGLTGCSKLGFGKKSSGSGSELSENELNAEREARFGDGSIPTAEGSGLFRDISFEFDSSVVSDLARQDIEYNAQVLRDNDSLQVQLEGHCDERGTAEYNLALGAQRARAVRQVLISAGIPAARLDTISYGEEVPLVVGHSEDAWAKNRRVHFSPFGAEAAH